MLWVDDGRLRIKNGAEIILNILDKVLEDFLNILDVTKEN